MSWSLLMAKFSKFETIAGERARSAWLLSYGDMVTLLITFFIMMITLRQGQIQRMHEWVNDRLDDTATEVQQVVDDSGVDDISVHRDSRGVRITLNDPRLFQTASANPRQDRIYQLDMVARAIRNLTIYQLDETEHAAFLDVVRKGGLEWLVEIKIEGHTDNIPLTGNAQFRDNWELSAARAQTIMKELQQRTGLPPASFAIGGFGEYQPLGDNSTVAGRDRNRRVEVFVNAALVLAN